MLTAVLSDVHANLPALEAVVADARAAGAKEFAVLGDLVDRGPFPQETLALLRSIGTWFVTGNTDLGVAHMASGDAPEAWRTKLQFAPLRWTAERLGPVDFLESLPATLGVTSSSGGTLRLTHGTRRSASEGLFPERAALQIQRALDETAEDALLCGHTHHQWCVARGRQVALNPGSVGISFGAGGAAQYALLTWREDRWSVDLRSVSYDRERTLRAYEESGYLEGSGYYGRAAYLSVRHGSDVIAVFLEHLRALREAQGATTQTDALWEEAGATFDWSRF